MLTTLPFTLNANQLPSHHVKETYNPISINSLASQVQITSSSTRKKTKKVMLFSTTQLSRTHQLVNLSTKYQRGGAEKN